MFLSSARIMGLSGLPRFMQKQQMLRPDALSFCLGSFRFLKRTKDCSETLPSSKPGFSQDSFLPNDAGLL